MIGRMTGFETLISGELYPTPRWFPREVDQSRQWVRITRFEEEDYRQAPFLDRRGLRKGMIEGTVPWRLLADLTSAGHRSDAGWIFHISHVGSTLISRLLGECGDIVSLREPVLLRSLLRGSTAEAIERLPVMRRLFSRCFLSNQRTIIKASSVVSELAVPLVGPEAEGGKALFLSVSPQKFIVGRLARGREELLSRAPERLARLRIRIPMIDQDEAMANDARVAAMSWACEASSIEAAMGRIDPARWHFLDFADFLKDPGPALALVAGHFGLECSQSHIASVVSGPQMRQNAKGRGQHFEAERRQAEKAKTIASDQDAIEDALNWLERIRASSPLLDRACARYR